MQFLKTVWQGYTQVANRQGQTEICGYNESVTNSTQDGHDTKIAGKVVLEHVSWKFKEDASVPAVRQKLIDQETIPEMIFEDVVAGRAATVIRRTTLTHVNIVAVDVALDDRGSGLATVTARCSKAKWERLTPDGTYAESEWNPNGI
jgi:type VI protein secretion system component Hcp